MASVSGIPRCVGIVGSMNRMPFDAHKNPNETIQTRTVVRARPGVNSSNTVTPVGTATFGFTFGAAFISSSVKERPRARCSMSATILSASATRPLLR
jgi:hypothetical protein